MLYVSEKRGKNFKVVDSDTGLSTKVVGYYDSVLGYVKNVGLEAVPKQLVSLLDYVDNIEYLNDSPGKIQVCHMSFLDNDIYGVVFVTELLDFCSIFDMLMKASYDSSFNDRLKSGRLVFGFRNGCVAVSFCNGYEQFVRSLIEDCRGTWRKSGRMRSSGLDLQPINVQYISDVEGMTYTVTSSRTGKSFKVTERENFTANPNRLYKNVKDEEGWVVYDESKLYDMSGVLGYFSNQSKKLKVQKELVGLLRYINRVKYVDGVDWRTVKISDSYVKYRSGGNLMVLTYDGVYHSVLDWLMIASNDKRFPAMLESGIFYFGYKDSYFILSLCEEYVGYVTKFIALRQNNWRAVR